MNVKHISMIKEGRKPIDPYLKLMINSALHHSCIASDYQIETEARSEIFFLLYLWVLHF